MMSHGEDGVKAPRTNALERLRCQRSWQVRYNHCRISRTRSETLPIPQSVYFLIWYALTLSQSDLVGHSGHSAEERRHAILDMRSGRLTGAGSSRQRLIIYPHGTGSSP